ncbi:MAG: tetratricopeptide repeat protein [Paludibacter sp.]|jgi:Tfp pilus assembly protein PilF|nr:tetratricopeptide repeat protein [Paludibacter sp.]
MKKFTLILGLLLSAFLLNGQNTVDNLVQIGIEYHDKGEYSKAIETYKEALQIEPKSYVVNYEIAFSYNALGDYQNAIKYSDIAIKFGNLANAYILKGSCLDELGRTKESIKLFEKAIKKFKNEHLLYFNLGIDYFNIGNNAKAENAFINAINVKSNHSSSHFMLGRLKNNEYQRAPSLLSLYYFLMLEPNSKRSTLAYELLNKQLAGNVKQDTSQQKNTINISLNSNQIKSEFGAAEMMIGLLGAAKYLDENKDKSSEELFVENTKSFFSVLGELKELGKNKNFWWNFYVPFFYDLAKSDYLETFCYYISQSSNEKATKWLEENAEKLNEFQSWLLEK